MMACTLILTCSAAVSLVGCGSGGSEESTTTSGAISSTPTSTSTATTTTGRLANITVFHWNAHAPCATENVDCIAKAQQRLGEMVLESGASIVGAVEIKNAASALPDWSVSSPVKCDDTAVLVAPGWSISKSGGACINGHEDYGFAVALVTPPQPVGACPELCVMAAHVPNDKAMSETSEVARVCGAAAGSCMVAMGDWNTNHIDKRWDALIGGSPTLVTPTDMTCCYPMADSRFDHTATNIPGASSSGSKVYDFQLSSFGKSNEYEHKPVSVQLEFSGGEVVA